MTEKRGSRRWGSILCWPATIKSGVLITQWNPRGSTSHRSAAVWCIWCFGAQPQLLPSLRLRRSGPAGAGAGGLTGAAPLAPGCRTKRPFFRRLDWRSTRQKKNPPRTVRASSPGAVEVRPSWRLEGQVLQRGDGSGMVFWEIERGCFVAGKSALPDFAVGLEITEIRPPRAARVLPVDPDRLVHRWQASRCFL